MKELLERLQIAFSKLSADDLALIEKAGCLNESAMKQITVYLEAIVSYKPCAECGLIEGCHTLGCSLDNETPHCEYCGAETGTTSYGDTLRFCGSGCENAANKF